MTDARLDSATLTRRNLLALGVGAFVVATIPLAGTRRQALVRRTMPVMGTIAEFAVVAGDPATAHAAIDAAMDELARVETLMTRFTPTSDVGRANRDAGRNAVAVSPATAEVLREALEWAEASDGAFDPALGRAIETWDVANRRTPPPAAAVRALAGRGLYRGLDVSTRQGRPVVRFADRDLQLDLGGIAKGYGVDRATEALRRRGIERAIVNVGGDLYALGDGGDGAPWRIGIQSPYEPGRLIGELAVRDTAVATSGDYLRYFTYAGRRYHHILDPATAAPRVTAVHSLTTMADTCLAADAAATAVYGMPPDHADRLLATRRDRVRIVHVIAGEAAAGAAQS